MRPSSGISGAGSPSGDLARLDLFIVDDLGLAPAEITQYRDLLEVIDETDPGARRRPRAKARLLGPQRRYPVLGWPTPLTVLTFAARSVAFGSDERFASQKT